MKTLVLAHYYTIPEVQQMADFVGDSLELSLRARESNAERIVFAGVKFMAETAKIINPNAEVILPNAESTCSLVTQSNEGYPNLKDILEECNDHTVVTYINSSYRVKALSDVIVTSANVEDIVADIINEGHNVFFTPDRNMGAYLLSQHPEWTDKFIYYTNAVCEVHDKFKAEEINKVLNKKWKDYPDILIAHPESPLPVLERAHLVGSTSKMLNWIIGYRGRSTIYVATEEGLLYNMTRARPDLDIRLAPMYTGCQCNACPYMKLNTVEAVKKSIYGGEGLVIDYISELDRMRALVPIQRMLKWGQK
jgi:quinolinate synthase